MQFNLADFLLGVSRALDFIEEDLFGVPTNHSKRVAYLAWKIGNQLALSREAIFDLVSLAMLHDNGATMKLLQDQLRDSIAENRTRMEQIREHCSIGEKNILSFPFLTNPKDIILYHHENHDGSGFYGLKENQIPLMAQIIHLADLLDLHFDLNKNASKPDWQEKITAFVVAGRKQSFSPAVVDAFFRAAAEPDLWEGLTDEVINGVIRSEIGTFSFEYDYDKIRQITKTFSRIIDAKSAFTERHSSSLALKVAKMSRHYHMEKATRQKLLIAADLHDLGKLGVANAILDKRGPLTTEEFALIKMHPAIARECLMEMEGFEEITEWIYNHHEKLNGSGYPRGLTGERLDFPSRLLTCLDIFQALQESRPYRPKMSVADALVILRDMVRKQLIDPDIVEEISKVFSK